MIINMKNYYLMAIKLTTINYLGVYYKKIIIMIYEKILFNGN